MKVIENIGYWKQAWEEKKVDVKALEGFWNNRAQAFNEKVSLVPQESSDIVDLILQKKILEKGMTILDIGCGPGKHTIPMAYYAKEVIALDIAENMLNHLNKNAGIMGLENIKTVKKDWKDINLDEEGWNTKFDLVFASMTPGVFNFHTLEKMIQASRKHCFLSGFVERRDSIWDEVEEEILKKYSIGKRKEQKIYYAFNVLWHLGYKPEIFYLDREWEDIRTLNETNRLYTDKISMRLELQEEDKALIKSILDKYEEDNKIKEKTEVKIGILTWSV